MPGSIPLRKIPLEPCKHLCFICKIYSTIICPIFTCFTTGIKKIKAETSGGDISVESVAQGQSRLEVFIWPSGTKKSSSISKEEIQKRLDELYDLKIEIENNKLTAIAKPKHNNMNWKNGLSISFKIFVTENVTTDLTTSGGNISLKSISGEQDITTSGGNLTIEHVKGKVKGVTSGGNIDVKDSDDQLNFTTSGGNIDATNCTGSMKLTTSGGNVVLDRLKGTIDAQTSGGDVRANEIRGSLEAHTSGGNVNMAGLACNLNTGTSGGDIKVAVTEAGKFIRINNSGGKIELELPAGKGYNLDLYADKIVTGTLGNFNGNVTEHELKGTLNGGGTQVTANGSSSKIILTFK